MKPSMAICERQPVEFHDGEIQGEEDEREDNEGREERHKLSFHLLGSQEPHEENGQRDQHQTKEGRPCPRVSRCPAVAGFVAVVTHILPLFYSRGLFAAYVHGAIESCAVGPCRAPRSTDAPRLPAGALRPATCKDPPEM